MKKGYLDEFKYGILKGWAFDEEQQKGNIIDLYIDNKLITKINPCIFREDLKNLGFGNGVCAFSYKVLECYDDNKEHIIEIYYNNTKVLIPNGRQSVVFDFTRKHLYEKLMSSIISNGMWSLDSIKIDEDLINISGWLVTPYNSNCAVSITVNDISVNIDISSRKVEQYNNSEILFFEGNLRRDKILNLGNELCFKYHSGANNIFNENYNYYYPLSSPAAPDAFRQVRIQGVHNDCVFNLTGYSIAVKLATAVKVYCGKPIHEIGTILDWGIGCGRVARFILDKTTSPVIGVDIDADNILWCNQNLPGIKAIAIDQDPPLPIEDSSVNLIYGISVFTHLDINDESLWLKELARVLVPGGYAMLSTHGEFAWWRNQNLGPESYVRWKKCGVLNVGGNTNLSDITVDQGRYVDVFTTREHIYNVWANYFEIIAHIGGYLGCYQDLVIVRSLK
jgi:SAM-dependent methyltransferase